MFQIPMLSAVSAQFGGIQKVIDANIKSTFGTFGAATSLTGPSQDTFTPSSSREG